MKIRFNGVIEKKTKGCPVCGSSRSVLKFSETKSYYLPSGAYKSFRMGQTYEVSERDGEFLLSYRYMKDGKEMFAFEVA